MLMRCQTKDKFAFHVEHMGKRLAWIKGSDHIPIEGQVLRLARCVRNPYCVVYIHDHPVRVKSGARDNIYLLYVLAGRSIAPPGRGQGVSAGASNHESGS